MSETRAPNGTQTPRATCLVEACAEMLFVEAITEGWMPASVPCTLPLHELGSRHRGLSTGLAISCIEAARVCLDWHHKSPITFSIQDDAGPVDVVASWAAADEDLRRAWANKIDTTEYGAYGCALAAVDVKTGMVAVRRAEVGTGADYYVAPPGTDIEDLEGCFRLEVSGTDRGDPTEIERRLSQKVAQALNGASSLPAIACVVGFLARVIRVRSVTGEP